MMDFTLPPIRPAIVDWQGDTPHARDYGDSYFMPGHGPAESETVFCRACELPQRFAQLPADGLFVIGETGFGTGLNCLIAAECFLKRAPAGARLHFASAELHPMSRRDLARAISHWPALRTLSDRLLDAWPAPAPGFHRILLHERIELTLMFGDAGTLWPLGPDRVDAWFLDGFAPSRNPGLWTDELLATIGRQSRPGAIASSFTAAGAVRRGLIRAGLDVRHVAGFGPKRHRLVAHGPGDWTPQRTRAGRALVVGAGLAGCTTARALAERGWQVRLVDPALRRQAPPALAAVLYTSVSHHLNAQNRFYQGALLQARRWLARLAFPGSDADGRLEGVIQHLIDPRIADKALRAIESGAWPKDMLSSPAEGRIRIEGAGCLRPAAWCRRLLDHPGISAAADRVEAIHRGDAARAELKSGDAFEGEAIVLCTAGATPGFAGLEWLPLRVVRGQVTFCRATAESRAWREAHCHAGYVTPAFEGAHCIGATFDRQRREAVIDPGDDELNLAELERNVPQLWQALGGPGIEVIGQHAGLRCQSPDTLPLVGPCPDAREIPQQLDEHVWLNIAHGSKGLAHTPLCADIIADRLSGHPVATDLGVMGALAPERFIERRRRRDPDWRGEP